MRLFKVSFPLCPVLFTEETGGMSEIEKVFFSVELIYCHKVLVENSSQNVHRIVLIIFDWADPVKNHCSIS